MKYLCILTILFIELITGATLSAQSTVEPTSITIGVDQINMVAGDTILHWGKNRSAFRGGFYNASDITNANTGQYSFAYGNRNIAEGEHSFALGQLNHAEGEGSITFGVANNTTGVESIALGRTNSCLHNQAIAIGEGNTINSRAGITLGNNLIVNNTEAIALGAHNISFPVFTAVEDRPIFFLGNGDSRDKGPSNAITVLFDGRMSLRTPTPAADLHLMHRNNSTTSGFRIENEGDPNSVSSQNKWWRFYVRSMNDELALYNHTSTTAVGEFNGAGVYSSLSDQRLKKNIAPLPYGLKEILKLEPKKYQFKHLDDQQDIGLIAQEVLPVIPELVSYNEQDDTYRMNYNGFGVVAIKAIQELHGIIAHQQNSINELTAKVELLSKKIE